MRNELLALSILATCATGEKPLEKRLAEPTTPVWLERECSAAREKVLRVLKDPSAHPNLPAAMGKLTKACRLEDNETAILAIMLEDLAEEVRRVFGMTPEELMRATEALRNKIAEIMPLEKNKEDDEAASCDDLRDKAEIPKVCFGTPLLGKFTGQCETYMMRGYDGQRGYQTTEFISSLSPPRRFKATCQSHVEEGLYSWEIDIAENYTSMNSWGLSYRDRFAWHFHKPPRKVGRVPNTIGNFIDSWDVEQEPSSVSLTTDNCSSEELEAIFDPRLCPPLPR